MNTAAADGSPKDLMSRNSTPLWHVKGNSYMVVFRMTAEGSPITSESCMPRTLIVAPREKDTRDGKEEGGLS